MVKSKKNVIRHHHAPPRTTTHHYAPLRHSAPLGHFKTSLWNRPCTIFSPPYNLPFYTSYALCDSTLRLDYTTGLYDWTKRLDSQELKGKGIMVSILHPGFNKTEMTKKYEHIW
jgi:hypothetical protein